MLNPVHLVLCDLRFIRANFLAVPSAYSMSVRESEYWKHPLRFLILAWAFASFCTPLSLPLLLYSVHTCALLAKRHSHDIINVTFEPLFFLADLNHFYSVKRKFRNVHTCMFSNSSSIIADRTRPCIHSYSIFWLFFALTMLLCLQISFPPQAGFEVITFRQLSPWCGKPVILKKNKVLTGF